MDIPYDTKEAAKFLGVSPRTLERWRKDGVGPYYIKEVGRIVYLPIDLKQWQDDNRRL